jgi:hypothetical protein
MADNRINEASWNLVNSLRDTNQAVANSVVAVQDRYMKFTQSMFLNGSEVLENQTESARNLMQEWRQQVQKQQEAFQRLSYATLDISMNFLRTPFSFYQQVMSAAEAATRQGLEYTQQATRQTMDVAGSVMQRGLEQARKATMEGQETAQ